MSAKFIKICYNITVKIAEIKEKVSPVFRAYGIKYASVFGSASRGEDRPESDIDFLVELGDRPMGMFRYMAFIEEIETRLGRKVDIVTKNNINKFLKPYILSDLKTVYEE